MAKRNSTLKAVVVNEHPVQSIREAGLQTLTLPDGAKMVMLANSVFPNHDENLIQLIERHIKDVQPSLIVLMGYMFDEACFQGLAENKKNILHTFKDHPVFSKALKERGFESRVRALAEACGGFIRRFADAAPNATVVYLPAWTHMGLSSEHGIVDWIINKKRYLDSWSENHEETATELPSDPSDQLPTDFAELFGLDNDPQIQVLPYGAGLLLNDKTLVVPGSFRRRNAGDAAIVQWEQMGYSIIQSIDGKASSAWWTSIESTMPEPRYKHNWTHEIGFTWDPTRNGQYGDYHRRCAGFFSGTMFYNAVFGNTIPLVRGEDGRRSIWVQGRQYTEETPGCLPPGRKLALFTKTPVDASPTKKG
jgi:hypothetical protein